MRYSDSVKFKWVNFSFKCFEPNVEEINFLLDLFKKQKSNNFDFCYLMVSNQLKWGIAYKKSVTRVGDEERIINYMNGLK